MVASLAFVLQIYSFLAITSPVESEILVIEGWISPQSIKAAVKLVNEGGYKTVLITGGPIDGTGEFDPEYGTYASQGYERLLSKGADSTLMTKISSNRRDRDRTYGEALALRQWSKQRQNKFVSLNLLSESVHSRRSRLLFQKALGKDVHVGIIALPPSDYPEKHWWKYSSGAKDVITETIAYLYARVFFWPKSTGNQEIQSTILRN